MPSKSKKRTTARNTKRPARARAPRRPSPKHAARPGNRLDELTETIEIVVPELSARLAALEHLLIEQRLCARDDLRRARAFVDMGRSGE